MYILKNNQLSELDETSFAEQTLSAVAWLNGNQVDISCFQTCLYKVNEGTIVDVKKVLPVPVHEDFYVNVISKGSLVSKDKRMITRRTLPKIDTLLKWKAVNPGDVIIAKGTKEEAILCGDGRVKVGDNHISLQQWLKSVFNWSSVQTYTFAVHKETNKTLSELRREYMEREEE